MNKKWLRIAWLGMVIIAVVFVIFALNHPEMSFPWNNKITYGIYGVYAAISAVLLIASLAKR